MKVVGPHVCGQRGIAPLVKGCEWMWWSSRACSAEVLISLWLQLLVLLATDPVTSPGASPLPSIQSYHPSVSGPPSGSKKSCELLSHSLCPHPNLPLLSCLAPHPSSSVLTALLSLHLADLSSMHPLMEDSLPDSTSVSNIISPCNWVQPRGIFSQKGSDLA